MSENGHLRKDFLRVAKRIVARTKKQGGRPLMERIFCSGKTASVSDGHVLLQVDAPDTGEGYIDPAALGAKDATFFVKGEGLNVSQAGTKDAPDTFTHHVKPADGDYPNIEEHFPQLTDEKKRGEDYYDVVRLNPLVLIDALDAFEKKGDGPSRPASVEIMLPKDPTKAPVLIFGRNADDETMRAMVMPLRVAK